MTETTMSREEFFQMVQDAVDVSNCLKRIETRLMVAKAAPKLFAAANLPSNVYFVTRHIKTDYERFHNNKDSENEQVHHLIDRYLSWAKELELATILNESILPYSKVLQHEFEELRVALLPVLVLVKSVREHLENYKKNAAQDAQSAPFLRLVIPQVDDNNN